jgi:hypothetical protein
MALKKKVTAKNGIVTEYHRIAMISVEVNQQNTILLYSYLSEDGRQIEKDYAEGKYKDIDSGLISFPYYDAQYLHPDYDGTMTIEKAYEYLKTLPEFEGAENV